MVIWPKTVARGDSDWDGVCALLRVLALDPRSPRQNKAGWYAPPGFYASADDLLERPMIVVDRKQQPAPYYSYSLRFNVSASVHGQIPIGDTAQLAEFRRAVNASLQGPLTDAERKRWDADAEFRRRKAAQDPTAESFAIIAQQEAEKAELHYTQIRNSIQGDHAAVLAGLIDLGASLGQGN